MDEERQVELIQQVMGASHLFSSSMTDLVERSIAEASDHQVSVGQAKLLFLISRPGRRLKVMDVAVYLGVTNAAASRAVDRLVQQGLVARTPTPEDRRAVDLTLTPPGKTLLVRFLEVRNQKLLHLYRRHSPEKLAQAAALLDELSVPAFGPAVEPDERCLHCGIHIRGTCFLRDTGRECLVAGALESSRDEE